MLALAPLSVRPGWQRRGVGSALMAEGHRRARELGYGYSTVLGSTDYYPRAGYVPAQELGIAAPDGIPAENLMAGKAEGGRAACEWDACLRPRIRRGLNGEICPARKRFMASAPLLQEDGSRPGRSAAP